MNHYNKRYIWYLIIISVFWSVIIAIASFSSIFVGDEEDVVLEPIYLLYLLGIYILIQILSIVFIVLKWRYTTYTLTDDALILNKGIIFKIKKTLPYNKIHAIDYKQNIIEKLFRIKKLSIDSGATMSADLAEIVIIESSSRIDDLVEKVSLKIGLNNQMHREEKNNKPYQYSIKYKFIDSITKILLVIVFALIIVGLLLSIVYLFGDKPSTEDLLSFLIFIAIVIVIIFLGHFISSVIRYYKYQVVIKDKEIIISYGIIQKIKNTLPLNKIKAITVEEGLIQRLFKICSIKLELVGYGNISEKAISNFYIPFCFKKDITNYINNLNLNFRYCQSSLGAPKGSFRYFISLPNLIFSLISFAFIPIVFIFEKLLFIYIGGYLFILLLIILTAFLKYKNTGIYIDNKEVIIYNGAFTKKSTIILNENITGIEKVDTYCRSKKDIASFHIHFYNNAYKNVEVAHLLDNKIIEDLIKVIRY